MLRQSFTLDDVDVKFTYLGMAAVPCPRFCLTTLRQSRVLNDVAFRLFGMKFPTQDFITNSIAAAHIQLSLAGPTGTQQKKNTFLTVCRWVL